MKKAFSLVEVVLALGIVSFALLAVVGLLPAGLKSVKNANENAGAANVLQAIAATVRSATPINSTNFTSRFADKDVTYSLGGITTNFMWTDLTLEGAPEGANVFSSPKRLSARLDIYPAASVGASRAVISVAWSAQGNPVWDQNTQLWTKSEGSVTSGIQFLPKK